MLVSDYISQVSGHPVDVGILSSTSKEVAQLHPGLELHLSDTGRPQNVTESGIFCSFYKCVTGGGKSRLLIAYRLE